MCWLLFVALLISLQTLPVLWPPFVHVINDITKIPTELLMFYLWAVRWSCLTTASFAAFRHWFPIAIPMALKALLSKC